MMPFKSRAQMRKFSELVKQGKMSQKTFDEWAGATPSTHKLPERVHPKKDPEPGSTEHYIADYKKRFGK